MKTRRLLLFVCVALVSLGGATAAYRLLVDPAIDMTRTAQGFLATLSAEQREAVLLKFDDPARVDWHFIPKPWRKGLQIRDMSPEQRQAALALLRAGLSEIGYDKAETIMELESILKELEKTRTDGPLRDPERYYFTVFDDPTEAGRWGWSCEGHHLSLNFVLDGGRVVSTTPSFFGANPATVVSDLPFGPPQGTHILVREEAFAFQLLHALTDEQKALAVRGDTAPADLRGAGAAQAPAEPAQGLPAAQMSPEQGQILLRLIESYADNMPQPLAAERMDRLHAAGFDQIHFAWWGAHEPGVGHYYVIEGPTFIIELCNTQADAQGNPANHIHSQWRDAAGDFGLPRAAAN